MDPSHYKYDVAFSLLAKDEGLAAEVIELLADRYSTFLYSERQKEIAGSDGELKFKKVFSEEARLVVVLYRAGWGETPWTRMEEEAIRGRAYDNGYDFVKYVPLDEVQSLPKYVPKVQLWINALRFGAKGVAAVIEARLEELGAVCRQESPVERARRLERQLDFVARHDEYARTHKAVSDANAAFLELGAQLQRKLDEIKGSGVRLGFEMKQTQNIIVIAGLKTGLRIRWHGQYANSIQEARLDIEIWSHHPPFPGLMFYEEPKKRRSEKFKFELLTTGQGGWTRNGDAFNSEGLADFALHYYMDGEL